MDMVNAHGTRFRMEADMLAPIAAAAPRFARNAIVMFEIASSAGVPDVVLLVPNTESLKDRSGTSALINAVDVRIMLALSAQRLTGTSEWSVNQIHEIANVTTQHLRRTILPRLVAGGHLLKTENGWRPLYPYRSLAKRVITIEAKVKDWRGALAQASRHTAVADASWVALDAAATAAALRNKDWFEAYGLGLMAVPTQGSIKRLIFPTRPRSRPVSRETLVERAMALHGQGKSSGQIPTVFGVRLTASTGADPRLEGVAASLDPLGAEMPRCVQRL